MIKKALKMASSHDSSRNKSGPSWTHRRRLIYLSFLLGTGMIVFAGFIYPTDTQVASQMVIGGVALLSIILGAYTAFATFEDVKLWDPTQRTEDE
jgi:DMSO/TMAO reductase YedYZ heme-binding membrane subunit